MHILCKFFTLTFALFFVLPASDAQPSGRFSTNSKKAEKQFLEAVDLYNFKDYPAALAELDRAIKTDPAFIEAYILKGDIKADQSNPEEALSFYRQALTINPDFDPNLYIIQGNLYVRTGRYQQAKESFQTYLAYAKGPAVRRAQVIDNIAGCDFGINAVSHPVPFNPVNLGDSINTGYDEYVNVITADDQMLYFTRKLPTGEITDDYHDGAEEDFFFSGRRPDSSWSAALNLGPPINTRGNEGAICISPDGQYLFFAACQRRDGYGSCDLYWAKKAGNRWTEPVNLGPVVNSDSWDSQPSFASDGKTLYFASKRPGGKGSSDIWMSTLLPSGEWTTPSNPGDSINTMKEEQSPFIHPDNQTLYFASRGHQGMGGFDLYYSRKASDGHWQAPVNLGYPINTHADEISLIVNAKGGIAYISSDKFGGKGRQDVYYFQLYKEAQPNPVTYLKGLVYDSETKSRLEARFELIDLGSGNSVVESRSDRITGMFLVAIPANRNYALNVSKEGYLFFSDHFSLTGIHEEAQPFLKNIPLQPIRVGESVVLKNIFFDTDNYELKPESYIELEKLTALLRSNPSLRIEISGHTDRIGSEAHNMELSKNRAKAVYDYLVNQGISPGRMTYAGYGFSRPVDTNETDQGRANNRRTEFGIIGL